jgi:hypothetical protein
MSSPKYNTSQLRNRTKNCALLVALGMDADTISQSRTLGKEESKKIVKVRSRYVYRSHKHNTRTHAVLHRVGVR